MDNAKIAEAVRSACLNAALEAYQNAGISGLCGEGRWECAVEAIRELDLETILSKLPADNPAKHPIPK